MKKKATLLWVDLEMTGLDPERDRILEVAAIATRWDLESMAEMTAVVKVDEKLIKQRMVGKFWEVHEAARRGLMEQNTKGLSAKAVERQLLEFMDQNFGKTIYLAGNSIHQDRKFIDREWPEVAKRLHYRMLDVSAWKIYFEGALGKKFVKREEHRALDDIRGSMEELKWYLGMIKSEVLEGAGLESLVDNGDATGISTDEGGEMEGK